VITGNKEDGVVAMMNVGQRISAGRSEDRVRGSKQAENENKRL
jgi:hypothetical protein